MLPQIAHISVPEREGERRGAARRVVKFGFSPSPVADGTRVIILDLSETGMRFQTIADLAIGELIRTEVPEAGPVDARIVWRENDLYGAAFSAPISRGAVSAVLLASPAHVEPVLADECVRSSELRRPVPLISGWLLWPVLIVFLAAVLIFVFALLVLRVSA